MNAVRISPVGPFVRNGMLACMGSLFAELARQASTNARREVETYTREIPELGFLDNDPRARAETLEHAMWLRHRTVELSPHNSELSDDDLGCIASMGELRAGAGLSLDARQQVLRVHTALMLREINEATDAQRGGGVDELMRMMTWFAPQGERGIGAYRQGFVRVLRRRMSYTEQVALLARSLLNGDPISTELAAAVDMELPDYCAVTVFRLSDPPAVDRFLENEIETLVKAHRAPVMWGPEGGDGSRELIALVPLFSGAAGPKDVPPHVVPDLLPDLAPDHLPDLVRDFALALGRPCAVGTATAPLSAAGRRPGPGSADQPGGPAEARLRPFEAAHPGGRLRRTRRRGRAVRRRVAALPGPCGWTPARTCCSPSTRTTATTCTAVPRRPPSTSTPAPWTTVCAG